MHIDSLRYFIALSQTGSFNRAAEELFISQQGLNRAITSLENEFDVKLVRRSRKGASLTRQGEIFLAHAESMLHEYETLIGDLEDSLLAESEETSRPLPLITTSYLSQIEFAPIRGTQLLERAQTRELPLKKLLERLGEGREGELYLVDLFSDTMKALSESGKYVFDPLFITHIGVVRHKDFPVSFGEAIAPESLVNVPMAYNCDTAISGFVSRTFADTPLANIQFTSTNSISLIQSITSGKTACLFDTYAFHVFMQNVEFHEMRLKFTPLIGENATTRIGFLFRKDNPPTLRNRRYIREVKQRFKANNADYLRAHPLSCISPLP